MTEIKRTGVRDERGKGNHPMTTKKARNDRRRKSLAIADRKWHHEKQTTVTTP